MAASIDSCKPTVSTLDGRSVAHGGQRAFLAASKQSAWMGRRLPRMQFACAPILAVCCNLHPSVGTCAAARPRLTLNMFCELRAKAMARISRIWRSTKPPSQANASTAPTALWCDAGCEGGGVAGDATPCGYAGPGAGVRASVPSTCPASRSPWPSFSAYRLSFGRGRRCSWWCKKSRSLSRIGDPEKERINP